MQVQEVDEMGGLEEVVEAGRPVLAQTGAGIGAQRIQADGERRRREPRRSMDDSKGARSTVAQGGALGGKESEAIIRDHLIQVLSIGRCITSARRQGRRRAPARAAPDGWQGEEGGQRREYSFGDNES